MMEIKITSLTNPFSFFYNGVKNEKIVLDNLETGNSHSQSLRIPRNEWNHGQYVAVMWQKEWVRGIVNMERQYMIWLVDYGIYIQPSDKTLCINLPNELKKIPSAIFEASIHGVMPVDKELNDLCEIQDVVSNTWNQGAINKAQVLIDSATKTYFQPVAVLSTKTNDIVLGDLYLQIPRRGIVNFIDELEHWPVFLKKNKEAYIENISKLYTSRRRHRAYKLNPNIASLPTVRADTSIQQYNDICESIPKFQPVLETDSEFDGDGSTVLNHDGTYKKYMKPLTLSAEEIEQYAHLYVEISGHEYNILNVFLNKIRDLNICERYKDHDDKSVGRGTSRSSFF